MKNLFKSFVPSHPLTRLLSLSLPIVIILLTSCHKTCVCSGYDQLEHYFTPEEVDAHGGNCSNMRDYPVANHYSVCSWE